MCRCHSTARAPGDANGWCVATVTKSVPREGNAKGEFGYLLEYRMGQAIKSAVFCCLCACLSPLPCPSRALTSLTLPEGKGKGKRTIG
uniref:Uncharacterized protein n=1 Tax=Globodera rostochiensis TaxID=31243 RepID=A0A914HE19_GLORO